jgi:predicted nucleic acid-binding protein
MKLVILYGRNIKEEALRILLLIVNMFKEIIENLKKLNIGQKILEVLEIAKKNNITFYDASYIYVAKEYKLKLVTEDLDLLKFPETISLEAMLKELKI